MILNVGLLFGIEDESRFGQEQIEESNDGSWNYIGR
jgi:hypothetical protein